jgi:hypothetical protein
MASKVLAMRHPVLESHIMWKILVGFAVFAALAVYILTKAGGNVDLGGEKHDVGAGAPHAAAPASAAPASAAGPASAASN